MEKILALSLDHHNFQPLSPEEKQLFEFKLEVGEWVVVLEVALDGVGNRCGHR